MAPNLSDIEKQTDLVILCLFDDEDEAKLRGAPMDPNIEHDGPDDFDPVLVADKLRTIADALNEDPRFANAVSDLKKAAVNEVTEAAFGQVVEVLCETRPSTGAEVAPELEVIKASVAFGLYIKKSCPELKNKVQHAMSSFLNQRVGSWIAQRGGWDKITDVSK